MRLKSIEIQGFKSFADKTVLKFGSGITAVVGPNGSGKSNISDAVRWVLGEQSNKTLRGNKMEDVIFGGTAVRKRLGFAEVTLVIDNTERNLQMDNDEVSVTRRYYRSGESEYRINNASVRLKDVHELFMDTGLGRDGYSMVGQGRIDDIVGTKTSSERREIFEEAAGISRFRYKKIEAERKLKQAEENLVRLRDILAELEARVGPLEQQSKKAKIFLEYSKEQEKLQIGLWLNTLSKYKESLRDQEYKITEVRAQYDALNSRIEAIESKIDLSTTESMQINILTEQAREKASQCEEEASKLDAEIAVNNNTIFHNNETIERIIKEINDINDGALTISTEIENKKLEIADKTSEIERTNELLANANESLLGLISDSDVYSVKIEHINTNLNSLAAQSADARVALMAANTTIDEITARNSAVDAALNEKTEILSKLTAEQNELSKDLDECENTISECSNSLKGRELILNSRAEKCDAIRKSIDSLVLDEGEKRRRIEILKELDKNMEGFGFAVKSVMQAAKSSALSGIHGPVSYIMNVEGKFSAAIECALGGALQNIVVDSENDAKKAINHLKNNKNGRATFLPLTSIKPRIFSEDGLDNCLGYVGMASELVKYDAKYKPVISYLLGSIVVAEDIDSAVSIAKKFKYRFKIVTLDGQVINAGGSLTGGSLSKNVGILSRSADIQKLTKQVEEITAKIADESEKYDRLKRELDAAEAEISVARSAIITAQEDKVRVLGEIKRVDEQIKLANDDIASLRNESDANRIRLSQLHTTKEKSQQSIAEIESVVSENQHELEQLLGGRDGFSDVRKELEDKVSELKTKIFELNKDIDVINSSIVQLKSFASDRDSRIISMNEEIEAIRLQNAEVEEQISSLNEQALNLRLLSQQSKDSVAELLNKRDELDKTVQLLRVEERDCSSDREKINGELVRLEERKVSMVHEYDDTIRKLFDEYGLTRSEAEEKGEIPEDINAAQKRLVELKGKIRALGSVNVSAIDEYKEVSERYEFMNAQVSDVEKSRDSLYRVINTLTEQMKETFINRFNSINAYFSKVFVELFGGGTAELKLSEPDNILESGIEIIVQPPGKNISIIEQLSGGEKALIAISIYFAVMKVNPPPFCILDEVDAALDDVNVTRFAEYLNKMSKSIQFILITHRRGSMEEADMLYGVTMQEKGVSKLLELNISEFERNNNLVR